MQPNNKSIVDSATITLSEMLYISFCCVILAGKAFGLSEDSAVYKLLLLLGLALLAVKALITTYTKSELLLTCAVYGMAIVSYVCSKDLGILLCCAVLIGIKGCRLRYVLTAVTVLWSISFVIMTVATQTGFVHDLYFVHEKPIFGYIVRDSFGYPHPNVLHISFLMITCLVMYLFGNNRKKVLQLSILLILANCYVFVYSVSFTGFLIAVLFLLLNGILTFHPTASDKRKPSLWTLFDIVMIMVFPVCTLFSVVGPVAFQGTLYDLSDKLVHHRFVLSNFFLTQEKLTLFGHILVHTPDANRSIDCSYVYLLVHNGFIPFLFFCTAYMIAIIFSIKKGQYRSTSVLLACTIAGVTEPFLFNTSFKNISLFIVGDCIFHLIKEKDSQVICLLPALQQEVSLNLLYKLHNMLLSICREANHMIHRHLKPICILCICSFLIAFTAGFGLLPKYTSVLIPVEYCPDGYPEPTMTLSSSELLDLQKNGVRLLSCAPYQKLALFQGHTALYENLRSANNLAVCITLLVLLIAIIWLHKRDVRTELHGAAPEGSCNTRHPSC